MKCKCGFRFSGPGEFRNCDAFITKEGKGGVTCPECGRHYVGEKEAIFSVKEKLNGKRT